MEKRPENNGDKKKILRERKKAERKGIYKGLGIRIELYYLIAILEAPDNKAMSSKF